MSSELRLYKSWTEIDLLISLLKQYNALIDSHLNDFIVNDLQDVVSTQCFNEVEYIERCRQLATMECCFDHQYGDCHQYCINKNNSRNLSRDDCQGYSGHHWPSKDDAGELGSENCYGDCCQGNDPIDGQNNGDSQSNQHEYHTSENKCGKPVDNYTDNEKHYCGVKTNEKHNSFLSIKKKHEITAMSSAISKMCSYVGCVNVVDVGSGKGYLGHCLTQITGMNVLGIEGSASCSASAEERLKKMNKLCSNGDNGAVESAHFKTINFEITVDTLERSLEFIEIIKASLLQSDKIVHDNINESSDVNFKNIDENDDKNLTEIKNSDKTDENISVLKTVAGSIKRNSRELKKNVADDGLILVGLHACGDLTANVVKLFTKECCFKALHIVGCCYNLCTESCSDGNSGFPISEYVQRKEFVLGKSAFMLACQCPEKWKNTNQLLQKSLLYRAIFEKLAADKNITRETIASMKFRGVGKKSKCFNDYVMHLTKNIRSIDATSLCCDAEMYYQSYKDIWDDMQSYHWLRMQLAPCIEKLILLDRLCYLLECGFCNASIVKLFQPTLSPRCYALVCNKTVLSYP